MSHEQATAPTTEVRHEIVVDAAVEDTFRVFAEMDRIKPREHNLLAVPIEATVVEPYVGGDIYDRGTDGSTCRWGRVLAFDPPHRFVLSWDIGPDWRIVDDPARASEVEVLFTALPTEDGATGPRTRVELTHRHLDRHGEGWQGVRQAVDNPQGWPLYLERLRAAVTG
ncbi:MAG TPA: SRPBCC family protein [Nocardioides sp.]|nr:SRPBCC family protein [Nocardioides sp.]